MPIESLAIEEYKVDIPCNLIRPRDVGNSDRVDSPRSLFGARLQTGRAETYRHSLNANLL